MEATFEDFTKELGNEGVEEHTGALSCPYCDWHTHPNSKDKPRGLRNHIRQKHPDEFIIDYPSKKKEIKIIPPKLEALVDDVYGIGKDEDLVRDKLVGDLDILRIKFPNISFSWSYNYDSSIAHLKRQKALFLRCLNDEAGCETVFNLLLISSKALEKIADVSNVVDLNGYAIDVKDNKEEIYPILKNMVDTGVLDVGHLSPELRLGMVMCSLAISRIETNKIQKKGGFLNEEGTLEEDSS